MSHLEVWLIVSFILSVTVNIFLIWYLRKLLRKFLFISQNLGDLVTVANNYQEHLKQVYNMEAYHGDETIMYLKQHTGSLIDILKDYEDVYSISVPLEDIEENLINDDNENQKADPEEETPFSLAEENVFYAGTRRGDS